MHARKFAIVLFLLFVLFPLCLTGQEAGSFPKLTPAAVTVYDIDRGMPISCVENMFSDPKGRLFVSPCRYQDIYQSLSFYQYDGNKSQIVTLETQDGKAGPFGWYLKGCTESGLLFGVDALNTLGFLYDPESGSKQIVAFDSTESIKNMIAGPENEVYVLTYSPGAFSWYRVLPESQRLLTRVPVSKESEGNFFRGVMPAVCSGDQIWFLLADKGFVRFSLADNSVKYYAWAELIGSSFRKTPGTLPDLDYTGLNMTVVSGGKLLFYLRSYGGFFVFDPRTEQLSRQGQLSDYGRQINLPGSFMVNFYRDSRQNVLVHFARERISGIQKASDLASAVLWDQDGQLFDYQPVVLMAGTGRYNISGGDFWYSRNFKKQVLIATGGGLIAVDVKANLPIKTGAKGWASRAMGEFDNKQVMILSESGNKTILDLTAMQAITIKCQGNSDPWCLSNNFGQFVSRDGLLWFSGNGRLVCYQKKDQSFRNYDVGQDFNKFDFIRDREIAFVNNKNELYRYDLDRGQSSPFLKDGSPLEIGGTPNELVVDKNGLLWIASLNGLWRIDPQTGASKRYGKADGLVDNQILCIHEAEDGELWLGTLGGGLQFFNPETGALRVLNQSMGLSNNSVVGILADAQGDRWISTFDGITVVSSKGTILFELSEEDGLAHREFNRYSYLKTGDGRLLFGGVNGVTVLEPEKIKAAFTRTEPLRIYLTDIGYYDNAQNTETHLNTGFDKLNRIVLPAAHRYLKLDFGLSDVVSPEKSTFSYRIKHNHDDGPDHNKEVIWTNIGSSSELLLNDLPVGSYTILIRGINAKGQWTEEPLAIPVTVQEFFYRTWWFYMLCALPLLLGAYFWIRRLQTERERLEAEVAARTQQILRDKELIEQQADALKELDELKSRFFTNISHEFRTPLTVISGMVTQIRKQPEQWLEKGMEIIQRNSNQLLTLINQILDLRKLESGALKVHLICGNIIPYLHYIAESFVQLAQAKGLRIHVLANTDNVQMDYDPDKMMHILSNLLSNAIKYTPAPGDIYLQIDRRSMNEQEQLTIQVRDTGQGIAPEALPYIFDQFYQVEDLPMQKPQGSGVGLALTRELVKLLGGSIEVISTPGAGTTFSLTFPITREAPVQESQPVPVVPTQASPTPIREKTPIGSETAEPAAEDPVNQAEETTSGLPTLLIVEDNADVRLYLMACLENHYRFLMAKDGQEGIDLALEQVPDLVVSDVMMPVKDGFALCDTLKNDERTSHIPIVLLTAKADFESKISGLRRGADAYLTKPFEQEELLVRLEQLLTLRKKLQERYRNPSFTGQEPGPETVEMEDAFILKLRRLVLDHLAEEDYGIVHLCRALGVGRTQLHNKLKALTGQSTSEFVRSVRLNKARELLQTTDMNVSEVSYEVGISNPAYFSRIYAEEFGEAPRVTRG